MTTPFETDDPWQDRLSEYVDGLLPATETRELEAHLETCESCRESVAELRKVVERLRSDRVDAAPEDVWPRIRNLLVTESVANRGRPASRYPVGIEIGTLRKIAAAAVLIVTFAAGIWAGITLSLTAALSTSPTWVSTLSHKLHIPIPPPGNERLQRAVQQLTRERDELRSVLDSVTRNRR